MVCNHSREIQITKTLAAMLDAGNLEPRSPTARRKGDHISASNRVRSGFEIRMLDDRNNKAH